MENISIAEPLLDATLMDGSRIVMTLGREVSTKGSTFTIRRFRDEPFTPVDLLEFKTFSSMQIAFLVSNAIWNVYAVVGGTASGKTTSLNACSLFLPWQHKIVSIEETRELNLHLIGFQVVLDKVLEENQQEVALKQLVKLTCMIC